MGGGGRERGRGKEGEGEGKRERGRGRETETETETERERERTLHRTSHMMIKHSHLGLGDPRWTDDSECGLGTRTASPLSLQLTL